MIGDSVSENPTNYLVPLLKYHLNGNDQLLFDVRCSIELTAGQHSGPTLRGLIMNTRPGHLNNCMEFTRIAIAELKLIFYGIY